MIAEFETKAEAEAYVVENKEQWVFSGLDYAIGEI